jgi:glucose/arabinose dehydrogenase
MGHRKHRVGSRSLSGVCTLFLMAACGPGAAPEPRTQDAALFAGEPLVSAASGKCLDVVEESRVPGTALQIYGCHGHINQAFTFTAAGELRTYDNTLCVGTAGGQTAQGTRAVIATCTGQPAQKWTLNANGTVVHTATGLCLDVEGTRTADETPVNIWACNGQTNQKWARPSVPDTQAPTPPSGLLTSNLTCNSVTLSWNASTDNVGVAFYDIYHDGQQMKSVAGNVRSTSLTLVPGANWGLYVNARDAAGNVSQASPTLPLAVPQCQSDTTPPTAPTQLTGSASGTSVTLSWNASTDNVGVTGYLVRRNGTQVGTSTGTTFVDSGLTANTSYTYTVAARDAQNNVSTASNTLALTTGAACTNPICSVTQVATDTDIPWGLASLSDGTVLYSRRDAQDIVRLNPATGAKTTLGTVPNVQSTDGEGGLLGLAIAPTFDTDRWLYIMHTSPTDNRIVRIRVTAAFTLDLASHQVLVPGLLRNKFHNGGRLRWGPDGKLYASTGDAQNGAHSQNTSNLAGKVLRMNPDGSVPSDNPFGNLVWSYGHRNPQGLAFDSSGRLWEQEFGNSVMDETNLIVKGGNYGWPNCEGTVSQGGSGCATPGYIAPKQTYSTADGSCSGIAIVRDVLYVACQRGTRLYREVISGANLTNVTPYFVGTYGRLRTVEPTVDGNLWLTTSNSGDKDSIPNNSNERVFRVQLGN